MSNFGKDNGSRRSPDVRSKSSLSSSPMLKSSALPWHSASNPQIGRATSPWSNSRKNSIGIGCTPANFRSSLPDGLKQTEKRNIGSPQGGSTFTVNRFKKTTDETSKRAGIRSPRQNNDGYGNGQGRSEQLDDSSGHFSDSILQCLHDVVENFTQTAGARQTADDFTDDDVGIDEDDVIDYNYSSDDSMDDRISLRLGNIHDDVTVDRTTNQRNGDNERRDSDGSEFLISRENSGCDESDDGELSECYTNRRHSRQEPQLENRISLKNVSQQTLEDRDTQTALTLHVGHQQLLLPSCKSISLGDWLVLGTSGRNLGSHLAPWNVIENVNESTMHGLEMNEKTSPSDPPKECRNFATQTFGQIEDAAKVTCETQTDLLFERHDNEIETRNGFSNGDELDVGTGLNRTHHERSVNRSGSEERTLNKSISEEVIRVLKETQKLILDRAATKLKNVAKSDEEPEKELPEEGKKKELLKIMLDEVRHLRSHVSQKTSGKSRSMTKARPEEVRKPKKQERKAESEDSAIESSDDDDNYRKDREMDLARSRLELLMNRDPVQPTDERDNKENWPWNGRKRDGRYVHTRELRLAPRNRSSSRETRVEAGQSRSVNPRHPTNPAHGLDNVDQRTSVPPPYNHWSQWGDASPFKRPAYDTQYSRHNTMYGGRSAFQQPQHYPSAQHPLHPTQLTQPPMFPTQHFPHEPMYPTTHFPQHSAYPEQYLHPSMYDSRQSFAPQPNLSNLVQPQSNFLTPARHHFSQNLLNPDENLGSYAGPIRQPTQAFSNHHPTSEPFSSAFRPINGNPKPQFVFVPTGAIQRQEPTIAAVRTGNNGHPISADPIPIQSREEPSWMVNPLQARPRDTNETRPHTTRGVTALQRQQHCGVFDLDSSIRRATKQAKEIKNISDKLLRHSLAQPPRT